MKSIYRCTTGGHFKQWSVYVQARGGTRPGWEMVTEYGPIGGTQQRTVKPFAYEFAARQAMTSKISEKLGKGYRLHGSSPQPGEDGPTVTPTATPIPPMSQWVLVQDPATSERLTLWWRYIHYGRQLATEGARTEERARRLATHYGTVLEGTATYDDMRSRFDRLRETNRLAPPPARLDPTPAWPVQPEKPHTPEVSRPGRRMLELW